MKFLKKQAKTRRAIALYYRDLEDRMEEEHRADFNRIVDRSLVVIMGMPVVALAGAATGYLVVGKTSGAVLFMGLTMLGVLFDLSMANGRFKRALREYHEDRMGREPRWWRKEEASMLGPVLGELSPVHHATVEARLERHLGNVPAGEVHNLVVRKLKGKA